MEETPRSAIACLIDPRAIAVVGATERPDASSFFVMKNLLAKGFAGPIHPVNPRGGTVFGLPAATALSELDTTPDVAVIGIAADRVEAALEEAGHAGVRAAVVLASGFAELDAEGRERQERLAAIARRHGMAVCGPNCLGLFNLSSGAALYSSSLSSRLSRGGLAILSHSGASAIALANCGRFGLSHIVSAGNGAVTDIPDYMAHLAGDPQTRVIGLVVEAIRDADAFAAAARLTHAAGKPVIALRAGRSTDGARATAAHTGAVAGANEAWEAFLCRCGVIEVPDMDGFVETAVLALSPHRAAYAGNTTRGVAIVGVSGGGVAHVADIAVEEGLALAAFAPDTLARLKALLPPFASPQNPLDTTGIAFARPDVYRAVLETVAADRSVAMIVAAQDTPAGLDDDGAAEYHGIADAFAAFFREDDMPAVFMSNLSSGHHPSLAPLLGDAPVLNGTRAALGAVRRWMDRPVQRLVAPQAAPAPDDDPWARRLAGGAALTEREAKELLSGFGLSVTRERLATSPDEAAAIAVEIGFPVAMKIESPGIAHKTEAGGVRLGVADTEGARQAFAAIMASAAAYDPEAELAGVLVQEMAGSGIEALVGLVRHEPFGLGVAVGAGGMLVELLRDAAFDLLPLDQAVVEALVSRTRLSKMLDGFRGAGKADRAALVETVLALARFAARYGHLVDAVDLNPVVVLSDGRGVKIVDALILPRARR